MSAGTVLVTGAARRIGAVIARALAADGWTVLAHYHRSGAEAERLATEIRDAGGRCACVRADLSNRAEVDALVPRCIAEHGPLDCLVNNAASFGNDSVATVTWQSLEANMMPNLAAPLMLSRDFARAFGDRPPAERPSAQRGVGNIINLLDQKVANLNPDFLSYTLSKVALAGLTQVLAMAFAGGIRVNGVAPGITLISGKQTPASFERAWRATPLGRSSTPEEIAACVRFILATPSMTGHTIFLDGGESLAGRKRDVAFDLGET